MPEYTNTSGEAKLFTGYPGTLANGEVAKTWDYVYPIPDGFELTSYNDPNGNKRPPYDELHNAVIGAGVTLTGLEQYDRIVIYNGSGDEISIVTNEATDVLTMGAGATYELIQAKDRKVWSKLVITGSGGSAINVTGWQD